MADEREIVHATAVALQTREHGARAALIQGPSGSGKSDLALRCLTLGISELLPHPVRLISDDQVALEKVEGDQVRASAPDPIAMQLEVRGLGIMPVPSAAYEPAATVQLVVDISPGIEIERFPLGTEFADLLGIKVPVLRLSPFEVSAPAKLILALQGACPIFQEQDSR